MKREILITIRTALILALSVLSVACLAWILGTYTPDPELIYHGSVDNILSIDGSSTVVIMTPDKNISCSNDLRYFDGGDITHLTTYNIWTGKLKSLDKVTMGVYWIYIVHPSNNQMYYLLSTKEILTWNDTEGWNKLNPRKNIIPLITAG